MKARSRLTWYPLIALLLLMGGLFQPGRAAARAYDGVLTTGAVAAEAHAFDLNGGLGGGGSSPLTVMSPSRRDLEAERATIYADVWGGENFRLTPRQQISSTHPVIDVWYGSHQAFGQLGTPQRWINILGNVSDSDGIDTLIYSLNAGPVSSLSVGPDGKRLLDPGDFNIDIPITHTNLISGLNQVVITATDTLSNTTVETVTVTYNEGNSWPIPYIIDWSSVATISDVAQVVDGLWVLEGDSIRPSITGYDRLVAIGDIAWDDYQILVPVTIHSTHHSDTGGVGVITRWQGHFHEGDEQPATGWWEFGAYGYYRYRSGGNHLALRLAKGEPIKNFDVQLDFDKRYLLKMQVETTAEPGGLYRLKVWEDGAPEPDGWQLTAHDNASDLANGSVLLVAHEADASFGDVAIAPLSQATTTLTATTVGSGTLVTTPYQPQYNFGQVVTLTATADPHWGFAGWSGDLTGSANPATLVLTEHHVVTATFTQNAYNLTIYTDGNGSVAREPERPTYTYGQVVTLTAMADPGWSFEGWGGDVADNTNPVTLNITGNHVITATFTGSDPGNRVFLPLILR